MSHVLKKTLLILLGFSMFSFLFAEENNQKSTGFEAGAYGAVRFTVSDLNQHHIGDIGGGAEVYYGLPINLPKWMPALGVNARVEIDTPMAKERYIESWLGFNLLGGVWADFSVLPWFTIRPELGFGTTISSVKAPKRGVDGAFLDFMGRVTCGFIFEPDFVKEKNLAFAVGLNYSFMPEKDNFGHYFGMNLGILYKFMKK